jgi:hypothetical protein
VWVNGPGEPGAAIDTAAARAASRWASGVALPEGTISGGIAPSREPVARWARRLLNCPVAAARPAAGGAAASQLDSLCNVR